jgi:hypothetical protein
MGLFEIETKFYSRRIDAIEIYVDSLRTQRDKLLESLRSYSRNIPSGPMDKLDKRDQCNSVVEVIEDLARYIQEINDRIEEAEINIR